MARIAGLALIVAELLLLPIPTSRYCMEGRAGRQHQMSGYGDIRLMGSLRAEHAVVAQRWLRISRISRTGLCKPRCASDHNVGAAQSSATSMHMIL